MKLEQTFLNVIVEILDRGWICAWSYSDSGDADIREVVSQVSETVECKAKSFVTPHEHKSQRGKKPKKVLEYLILFIPQSL